MASGSGATGSGPGGYNSGSDSSSSIPLIDEVLTWFKEPFNANGSALNWILFVGLLFVAAWLWHTVLLSIKAA